MIKMAVKTEMKRMTRKSDGKQSGMYQLHAITPEPVKFERNQLKWHGVMMTLLLLYTHDSNGDGAADFCPIYIPELKKR
jgi:hypothetical protein